MMMNTLTAKLGLAVGCLLFAGLIDETQRPKSPAQVVALDECDPATFNLPSNVGPGFCKNIALGYTGLGYTTTFSNLVAEAASGHPDKNWDFEPDNLTVNEGTPIIAVNQGGEPHTFTEVATFGGGFGFRIHAEHPKSRRNKAEHFIAHFQLPRPISFDHFTPPEINSNTSAGQGTSRATYI